MRKNHFQKSRFTLVELLIVVVIQSSTQDHFTGPHKTLNVMYEGDNEGESTDLIYLTEDQADHYDINNW